MYLGCEYQSMPTLKLIHVDKRGPRWMVIPIWCNSLAQTTIIRILHILDIAYKLAQERFGWKDSLSLFKLTILESLKNSITFSVQLYFIDTQGVLYRPMDHIYKSNAVQPVIKDYITIFPNTMHSDRDLTNNVSTHPWLNSYLNISIWGRWYL